MPSLGLNFNKLAESLEEMKLSGWMSWFFYVFTIRNNICLEDVYITAMMHIVF